MIGLTPRQAQAYHFICRYVATQGESPKLAHIAHALGLACYKSGSLHELLQHLERRGHIRRRRGECRGIELCATIRGRPFRFIPKTRAEA